MFLEPAPQAQSPDSLWQRIRAIVSYLFFWIVFSAIGLWLMLEMREAIIEVMLFSRVSPLAARGFDPLVILLLGLLWLIAILWLEHYLRKALGKKRLLHNIARVATVQALVAAITFGIRLAITPGIAFP